MTEAANHNVVNHNVEWDVARLISFENSVVMNSEVISLHQAIGRTCAVELVAESDLPPAHTAMMDGFAVSGPGPWKISGEVRAGQYQAEIEPGTALRVSTGAHIPATCSFVIPNEEAIIFENDVASRVPLPVGKHIRIPGDEVKTGEVVLPAGTVITPVAAGLAASSSIDEISVYQIPSVDVLVTGDELIDSGKAQPGRIRDSLSIQIPHWINQLGGQIGQVTRVQDDQDSTRNAIASCLAPIIITTGGTAHGDFDYVRRALDELDAQILIDEIKMRPGHPSVLAKLPSGQLVASLPGNPLAALVSFMTIVAPALNKLLGQSLTACTFAPLRTDFEADRTRIIPVDLSTGSAEPTQFRGSAMLRGLASANALAVIESGENSAGTQVRLLKLPWY